MEEKGFLRRHWFALLVIFLLALGAWGYLYSGSQPSYAAVITHVSNDVSSRHHNPRHGSSYTVYTREITVSYEENGEAKEEALKISYRNKWSPPRVGMNLSVTRNLLGKLVPYPDSTLRDISAVLLILGGVLAALAGTIYLLSIRSHREEVRTEDASPSAEPDPSVPVRLGLIPGEDESWHWVGTLDEAFVRQNARKVLIIILIISLCITVLSLIISAMADAWAVLWAILAVDVIMLVIGLTSFYYMEHSDIVRKESYHMRKDGIVIGSGKYETYYSWNSVREIQALEGYLLICGKIRNSRVYASPEQMPFIREYIRNHVPAGTVLR